MKIYSEITPLKEEHLFVIQKHTNAEFDYPIHLHPEFELNVVINCSGNRIVGDSFSNYKEIDIVLLGPNLYHKWERTDDFNTNATVITVQFEKDLINNELFSKKSLKHIKTLLKESSRGLSFTGQEKSNIIDKLMHLHKLEGFEATIAFLSVLDILARCEEYEHLTSIGFCLDNEFTKSRRIHKTYDYIIQNYNNDNLSLKKIAEINNMSQSAFSHFFKKRTNKNFTEFVIDYRITQAIKLLQETNETIRQICFECGFNNISNFNRHFKKRTSTTPKEYRLKIQRINEVKINLDNIEINN